MEEKRLSAIERAKEAQRLRDEQAGSFDPASSEKKAWINEVVFSGRLGKDPEISFTPKGQGMLKFSFAVGMPQGKERDWLTQWFDVVVWIDDQTEDMVNVFADTFHKGDSVVVRGRMTMRSFEGKYYYGITATALE